MLYKKSLLYNTDSYNSFNNDKNKESIKNTAKQFFEDAKDKINDVLSDENVEKAKQKANEFAEDAKEAFSTIKGKGAEIAGEAAEHLADFAEDAKEDLKQASNKVKGFIKNISKK